MAITDITLLLIMLAGLICLHQHGGGTFGLAQFLWKQVWWQFLLIVVIFGSLIYFPRESLGSCLLPPPRSRRQYVWSISRSSPFQSSPFYVLGVDCFELEW